MIGRTYLERGQPVVVLKRWGDTRWQGRPILPLLAFEGLRRGGPRNVLIRRVDGERVVRPFRGLRKLPDPAPHPDTTETGGRNGR